MSARLLALLVAAAVAAVLAFGWFVTSGAAAPPRDDPRAHLPVHPAPTDHAPFFRPRSPTARR